MAQSTAQRIEDIEAVWDIAHQDNFNIDHAAALTEHDQFKADLQAEIDLARADATIRWQQTEAARKATAERLKLIGPDKLMMATIADEYRNLVIGLARDVPSFASDEATVAFCDLITRSMGAAWCFEQAGKELK